MYFTETFPHRGAQRQPAGPRMMRHCVTPAVAAAAAVEMNERCWPCEDYSDCLHNRKIIQFLNSHENLCLIIIESDPRDGCDYRRHQKRGKQLARKSVICNDIFLFETT